MRLTNLYTRRVFRTVDSALTMYEDSYTLASASLGHDSLCNAGLRRA
jgi:hypothetical protein